MNLFWAWLVKFLQVKWMKQKRQNGHGSRLRSITLHKFRMVCCTQTGNEPDLENATRIELKCSKKNCRALHPVHAMERTNVTERSEKRRFTVVPHAPLKTSDFSGQLDSWRTNQEQQLRVSWTASSVLKTNPQKTSVAVTSLKIFPQEKVARWSVSLHLLHLFMGFERFFKSLGPFYKRFKPQGIL